MAYVRLNGWWSDLWGSNEPASDEGIPPLLERPPEPAVPEPSAIEDFPIAPVLIGAVAIYMLVFRPQA